MKKKQSISFAIVARNEEKKIRACLESIKDVADEIILVHDRPCQDKTLSIASEYTDKIFIEPQMNSAEAHRRFTINKASCEWLFFN